MSILATEAPFSDFVALGAGRVGRRLPLKHRPLLLGDWVAEQRGALFLHAQVREHDWKRRK